MTDPADLAIFTTTTLERVRAKIRVARMEPLSPADEDLIRAIEGVALVAEKLCAFAIELAERVPASTDEISRLVHEDSEDEFLAECASRCLCCTTCGQQVPCVGCTAGGVCDQMCRCDDEERFR